MTPIKKLSIGIEDFEKVRINDFYYIDKTGLIIDFLHNWSEATLFTRPRRFGKSLNMSMLRHFFEVGCDKTLFHGLKVSKEKELCEKYMGQFPVISITLKGIDGLNFVTASAAMRNVIGKEALRFEYLLDSDKLSGREKELYAQLVKVSDDNQAIFAMSDSLLADSLQTLSMLLCRHYGQKAIILIDEYDVPLDKAFQSGYYEEMVLLIRNLLGNALKSNDCLQFAILTGCLRISKESIFTGLNNIKVHTITDTRYDEYFGFTEEEVQDLLDYYHLTERLDLVREWYDGYRFGNVSVYCLWDVINYCDAVLEDPQKAPENYWANTSGNAMVRRFIDKANQQTRNEVEQLIGGESITKAVHMELTYNELDTTIDHLWSVLFTTGYLTQKGRPGRNGYQLSIPNREIRELFVLQIKEWFRESTSADSSRIEAFCAVFPKGNAVEIEEMLNTYLWESISFRDTAARKERKESFYHRLLLGLLQYENSWLIKSNAESGEGFSDILIETPNRTGIVIEIKYAQGGKLDQQCEAALKQIEDNHYEARLIEDGMKTIVKYGIAFYKKQCRVLC